ncbi:MAG TPA: RimK family alpha-L-glutamate ligase [Nanoarchaeota archaeon]|nr:RimK family alpha-L-glutamate ligase [Nanoarchaeota archaeon]
MKLALLGPEKKDYSDLRLLKEAKQVFDTVTYFPLQKIIIEFNEELNIFYRGKDITEYDVILPRIPSNYMEIGYTVLKFLKSVGCKLTITPESVIYTHNKFLTLIMLAKNFVPVPSTYLSLKRSPLEMILEKIDYPVVLKILYGCQGKGVMFADSKQSAISIMDTLETFKQPVFVEEYIENPGEDIRALVVGDKVVASMKRKAKKGERRANIGVGGVGEKYELTEEEKELAIKAAKVLGMGIAGVDMLKEKNKNPVIIEVNVYPGFKGLENATGKNVAKEIIEYAYSIATEEIKGF